MAIGQLKTIGLGNVVDDGRGDYLRKGGESINSNFTDIYSRMGDGTVLFPSGAWEKFNGTELNPQFGQSIIIDTNDQPTEVKLPKGSAADYGKVIKLRDVWGTWGERPVTLVPALGDTLKGSGAPKVMNRDFLDLELVYSSPSTWQYLENKMINKLSTSDLNTVAKKEIVATQGQVDFLNVFGDTPYNKTNTEVYRKGNLLYYGDDLNNLSDYGSPKAGSATELAKLDGKNIRLKVGCDEGDVITIVTYLDDLAVFRSSYMTRTLSVYGTDSVQETVAGVSWKGDLSKKRLWTLAEFGLKPTDGQMNPDSTEVILNGTNLTMSGRGNYPIFSCEDADGNVIPDAYNEGSCGAAGGVWGDSGIDYTVIQSDTGRYDTIKIAQTLEDGDVLTIRWYNNDIGTTMDWDEIKEKADDVYINSELLFTREKKIRYNSYNNPTPCNIETVTDKEENIKLSSIGLLLETIYPIGSVYLNAHNKNNPKDYMGFGTWVAYAKGQTIVGWNDDPNDPNFNKFTGSCGTLQSPGGSGGELSKTLEKGNIPTLSSNPDKTLIADPDGDILIGQCMYDPEGEGPGYHTYREDFLNVNKVDNPTSISLLQPYVTVAAWLRVA